MKADVEKKAVQTIEVAGCDTVPKLFHHRVAEWGARTAFREKRLGIWRATSWRDYGDRAKWTGLGLVSLGLQRGEVVSILAETMPEWLYADRGVMGAGGVSNGISPNSPLSVFAGRPIAGVAAVVPSRVVLFIAQVLGHLGLHGALQHRLGQLPQ